MKTADMVLEEVKQILTQLKAKVEEAHSYRGRVNAMGWEKSYMFDMALREIEKIKK